MPYPSKYRRLTRLRALLAVATVALVGITAAVVTPATHDEVDPRGTLPARPTGTPNHGDPGILGPPPSTPYHGDPGILGPPPITPYYGDPGILGPQPSTRDDGDQSRLHAPLPRARSAGEAPCGVYQVPIRFQPCAW